MESVVNTAGCETMRSMVCVSELPGFGGVEGPMEERN